MMRQICIGFILLIIATGCSKNKSDWYLIEQLDSRTYIISEPNSTQGNSSYLIIGDNEAILFDSGTGENKEQSIIHITDSLTNLPITVLLSHFHFDHIGYVNDFNRIGIPETHTFKNRLSIDSLLTLKKCEVLSKDTLTLKITRLFPAGKELDLGNRKIKIIQTPGHSKESISIVDNENRYIFTGDLIYNGLLLVDNCDAYIQSIDDIMQNCDSNYRIFGSHGKPEVDFKRLSGIKKALKCYLTDNCTFESVNQINFFGSTKEVLKSDAISFIVGYTDAFDNED